MLPPVCPGCGLALTLEQHAFSDGVEVRNARCLTCDGPILFPLASFASSTGPVSRPAIVDASRNCCAAPGKVHAARPMRTELLSVREPA